MFLVAFCLMAVTTAFGQGRSIQGQVVASNDSEPLVGVEVVEKGTGNGTVTDANGRFSLTPRGNNPTLQFSYVGFLTQQVKVGNKNNLSIRLDEDVKALNDVVVIGYGVQKKSDLTGAVASVKGDEIKNLSTSDAAAAHVRCNLAEYLEKGIVK